MVFVNHSLYASEIKIGDGLLVDPGTEGKAIKEFYIYFGKQNEKQWGRLDKEAQSFPYCRVGFYRHLKKLLRPKMKYRAMIISIIGPDKISDKGPFQQTFILSGSIFIKSIDCFNDSLKSFSTDDLMQIFGSTPEGQPSIEYLVGDGLPYDALNKQLTDTDIKNAINRKLRNLGAPEEERINDRKRDN